MCETKRRYIAGLAFCASLAGAAREPFLRERWLIEMVCEIGLAQA